jgi:NhaP-type Na+/H+ or K+/H+ antiporter
MTLIELLVGLLLCSVVLSWVARRLHVPYAVALVNGGFALGFVPELPRLPLDPELILAVFLPPVLSWAAAFALGAIVSPPDAVAATAILNPLRMPRGLVTVLEGESLVNDASGLVLYKIAVAAAVIGTFSWHGKGVDFLWIGVGGVVLGMLLGRLFVEIQRRLGDTMVEVLFALSLCSSCGVRAPLGTTPAAASSASWTSELRGWSTRLRETKVRRHPLTRSGLRTQIRRHP